MSNRNTNVVGQEMRGNGSLERLTREIQLSPTASPITANDRDKYINV